MISRVILLPWYGFNFHFVMYSALTLLALIAHSRAQFTDPGAVPRHLKPPPLPSSQSQAGATGAGVNGDAPNIPGAQLLREHPAPSIMGGPPPRVCRRCKTLKPFKAHHCSTCSRCIIRMDHHWYSSYTHKYHKLTTEETTSTHTQTTSLSLHTTPTFCCFFPLLILFLSIIISLLVSSFFSPFFQSLGQQLCCHVQSEILSFVSFVHHSLVFVFWFSSCFSFYFLYSSSSFLSSYYNGCHSFDH